MDDDIRCPKCGETNVWRTESEEDDYDYCICNKCGHTFNVYVGDNDDGYDDDDYDDV